MIKSAEIQRPYPLGHGGRRSDDLRLCFRMCKKPVFSRCDSYNVCFIPIIWESIFCTAQIMAFFALKNTEIFVVECYIANATLHNNASYHHDNMSL